MSDLTGECDKPGCNESDGNRYTDDHGNAVNVCDKHYWELVTGSSVPRFDSGVGVELSQETTNDPLHRTLKETMEERR